MDFEDFARISFKIGKTFAKQALAIANYSPELLEAAARNLFFTISLRSFRIGLVSCVSSRRAISA